MSLAAAYAAAGLAVFRRDALLFTSYRMNVVAQLLQVVVSLTLFYYLSRLIRADPFESPDEYFAFVTAGLVILQIVTATLTTLPQTLRQELVAGTFERLVVSPFGVARAIVSMAVFPFVSALALGAITVLLAWLVFGMPVEWSTAPLGLPLAMLGALAFSPFAIAAAAGLVVTKRGALGAGYVVTLFSLLAGVYFPVSLLPDWIEWASEVQPFTPVLDLMRHVLVGASLETSVWTATAKIALFAAVLLPASLWLLNAAIRFGRRRGTITEY